MKICDAIRWNESESFTPYNYHLLMRGVGIKDPIITFEARLAADFAFAHEGDPPPSPPVGPERSPWLATYDVEWWRLDAISIESPDLSAFERISE